MIDFELTEEQKQAKALVREFCEREVNFKELQSLADQSGEARDVNELRAIYPNDLIKKFHDIGLRQFCVPIEFGGSGFGRCGAVTRAIISEDLGYYMGIGARLVVVPWMPCCDMSHDSADPKQKEWFFSRFMNDPTMFVSMSGTEPSGNADMTLPYQEKGYPVRVTAQKDGNDWIINGDKMFSSGGGVAELIRVPARTNKEATVDRALTHFWVSKDTPGMSYTVNRMLAGEIAGNCAISYENVRVPDEQRVGEVNGNGNGGWGGGKIHVFVDIIGHCRRVYEQVVAYAKERMGGGVPIIQHSGIAAMLGETGILIDASRAFTYKVMWENDQREAAGKKLISWDQCGVNHIVRKTALSVCNTAFEVYAGVGGSVDLDLEGLVRRTYTWPQGNLMWSGVKYSIINNNHILACQSRGLGKIGEIESIG